MTTSSCQVPGIEKALSEGCKVHAFRSGGGLRVIRIEKDSKLVGYGEHPSAEEALTHVNDDYLAGGRPYHEVYGEDGKYPHYLTGSSGSSSKLDSWLLKGHTFDAWKEGDEVVFQLCGLHHEEHPEDLFERVKGGPYEYTTKRGVTYRSEAFQFPNGEMGVSMSQISSPYRNDLYRATQTGRGPDFWAALAAAFIAPQVEEA